MIYDFISFLSRIIDRGIKSYRREKSLDKGRSVFEKEREKGREKERESSLERERENEK